MKYKCIIVEDEPLAQDILQKYIAAFSSLQLVGCFDNASAALSYLNENTIDIVLLDINMPELSGIEFLKILKVKPQIILTTAYAEHALEGYEYAVCDYLLKPIRYERFLKAINVAIERIGRKDNHPAAMPLHLPANDHLFIKEENNVHKVDFQSILYIEAMGNYLKIHSSDRKTIITRATISSIESQLPTSAFLRVHKSYIVSMTAITRITQGLLFIENESIPIGATFKQEVMKKIKAIGIQLK